MVTVILSGGLGNQMFQYAAAKALACRLNTSLAIDLYTFDKKTQMTIRQFELDVFNIKNIKQVSALKNKFFVKGFPLIQKNRNLFQQFGFLSDTYAMIYQPVFKTIRGNIAMHGYFQNEKYFKNIEADIRHDFTFKKELESINSELASRILKSQSIAVHIRRGDYITEKNAANFIACSKEYYQNAIKHITNEISNPEFYVFSEDFDWIKENLNFDNHPTTYVDWNKGNDSYIDMQLMSLCKHNIIANSSFSWWSAWLNSNPNKIVIAPDKWYQDEWRNKLLDDFYPQGWTKIG